MTSSEPKSVKFVFVTNITEFFHLAMTNPTAIIVLRQEVPPTRQELRRIAIALGGIRSAPEFGEVRSVKYTPAVIDSTALSLQGLYLHTDGSFLQMPPGRFMLSFANSDPAGGGVSTFISVADILAFSPDWVLESLFTASYLFVRTYDGDMTDSVVSPVLNRDPQGNITIRWRADELWRPQVIEGHGTKAEEAVHWLQDFLATIEPARYSANTGETLLVPNTVMLHGRTPLSEGSTREVLRVWLA
jgi:hypothetical protein